MRAGPHFSKRIAYLSLFSSCALGLMSGQAQAGHLFTQNTNNTPTWIKAGQGIRINQERMEGGSGGSISLDFAANVNVPAGADTSNSDWWAWSAGDVLKFTVPLTGGTTFSTTIAYDADPNCTYDFCGGTQSAASFSATLASIGSAVMALGRTDVAVGTPLTWTLQALAGQFSLAGYRISFNNGRLNGTGAAALDQSSVIDSGQLGGQPDIDTAHAGGYTIDDVNGGLVRPVFNGGTLALNNSGSIATAFSVNDTGSGTDGVVKTEAGTVVVLTGDVTGAGRLNKDGGGILSLSGNNTNAGGFGVSDGVLVLTGGGTIAGGVAVNNGSTFISNGTVGGATTVSGAGSVLAGAGTFGDVIINTGASHKPGNSPGDVTVNGNYTLMAGGNLEIEVTSTGVSDRIFVNGNVNLAGNLVIAQYGTGFIAPSYTYTVLHNDGTDAISGDFASVSDNLAFYTPLYVLNGGDGNDLVITLNRNANLFGNIAATRNQRSVAGVLDIFAPVAGTPAATAYADLMGLLSADQVRTALGSLSGEIYASSSALVSDRFSRMLIGKANDVGILDLCGNASADAKTTQDRATCVMSNAVSVGVTGEYRLDNNDQVPATEFLIGGISGSLAVPFELDTGASHAQLGVFASQEQGRATIGSMASSADISVTGVGVTAGWQGGGWDIAGALAYGHATVKGNRAILTGAGATPASGSFGMDMLGASIGVGYAIEMENGYTIKPMGSLTHLYSANGAFSETTTNPFGYNGLEGSYSQTYATLGLGLSTNFVLDGYSVTPRAAISVNQRLGGTTGSLVGTIAGSTPFTTMGIDQGDTTAQLSLGVTLANSEGLRLDADYAAQVYDGGVAHSAGIKLKLSF